MKRTSAFASLATAVPACFLIACASDSGGGGGGGATVNPGGDRGAARQFYIDKVYPSMEPTCAKCHATGERGAPVFMASGGPATYNALDATTGLIADPSTSPLVQHGLHSGPALTTNQGDLVTQWLRLEVVAR